MWIWKHDFNFAMQTIENTTLYQGGPGRHRVYTAFFSVHRILLYIAWPPSTQILEHAANQPTEPPTSCISISCSITAAPTSFLPHPTCLRFIPSAQPRRFSFSIHSIWRMPSPCLPIHYYSQHILVLLRVWVYWEFHYHLIKRVRRMRIDFSSIEELFRTAACFYVLFQLKLTNN